MRKTDIAKLRYMAVWVDPSVHKDLKTEAAKEGLSIKEFIPLLLKLRLSHSQTNQQSAK